MGIDLNALNASIVSDKNPKINTQALNEAIIKKPEDKYISPTFSPNEGEHNIDVNQYSGYIKTGVFDNPTLENTRAENQGAIERTANTAGRLVTHFTSYLGQGAGQLLGVPMAIATQDLSKITSNPIVKGFDDLKEWSDKVLPDYETDYAKNTNILQKMVGLDGGHWLRTEGFDRAALAIATLVPGVIEAEGLGIAKLAGQGLEGLGIKSAEGVTDAFNFQKKFTATMAGKAVDGISPQAFKLANQLKGTAQIAGGTITQSALSGYETEKAVKQQLTQDREDGKNNFTDTEIDQKAFTANQKTFWETVPASLVTSLIVLPQLFSSFQGVKHAVGDVFEGQEAKVLEDLTKTQKVGRTLGKGLLTGIEGGPINENLQVAISKVNEDYTEGKAKSDDFTDILKAWKDNFSDPNNGQNNIGLGFLQGLIESAIFGHNSLIKIARGTDEYSHDFQSKKDLQDYVNKAILNYQNNDATSFNLKKEDGKTDQTDEQGNPILDKDKVTKHIIGLVGALKSSDTKKVSALVDDKLMANWADHDALAGLSYSLLGLKGGYEHINNMLDLANQKAKDLDALNDKDVNGNDITPDQLLFQKKEVVTKLKKAYNEVQNTRIPLEQDTEQTPENKTLRNNFLSNIKHALFQAKSDQYFIQAQKMNNDIEALDIQNGIGKNIKQNQDKVTSLYNENKNLDKLSEYHDIKYNQLLEPETLKELYNKYKEKNTAEEQIKPEVKKTPETKTNVVTPEGGEIKIPTEAPELDYNKQVEELGIKKEAELAKIDIQGKSQQELEQLQSKIEDKYKNLIDKLKSDKIDNFIDRFSKGETFTTPQDIEFYEDNKEEIFKGVIKKTNEGKTNLDTNTLNENPEFIGNPPPYYGLQFKISQILHKTIAGQDNDRINYAVRYFSYLRDNEPKQGSKLEIITKNNNPELYQQIVEDRLKDTSKDNQGFIDYNKQNPNENTGVYVVFTNPDGSYIYANQDGKVLDKGETKNLVYSTLLTNYGLSPDEKSILADWKKEVLSYGKGAKIYVNIAEKSGGIYARVNTGEKNESTGNFRANNPVKGRIVNDITIPDLLTIPTISPNSDKKSLINGQVVDTGRIYMTDITGNEVDLIPRYLTNNESLVVTALIAQRMGLVEKLVENASDELDKLIKFGIPLSGPDEFSIGVKDNNLFVGKRAFTIEDLSHPEFHDYLENFLKTKYINANNNLLTNNEEFKEPIFNKETHKIEYKNWNSYQEYLLSGEDRIPPFGTDMPLLSEPRYRNYYVNYDPTIISGDIKIKESEIKQDITSPESTEFARLEDLDFKIGNLKVGDSFQIKYNWEDSSSPYRIEKIFAISNKNNSWLVGKTKENARWIAWKNYRGDKLRYSQETIDKINSKYNKTSEIKKGEKIIKVGKTNTKIDLDRLVQFAHNQLDLIEPEERQWFKENFPDINLEDIKGLIDDKSLGRFIDSGKVLLSSEATKNTLRHEAFHVVSQLYLTPKEIQDLYKEVRDKFKNPKLSDLRVEEILAEDFANYKDTGKILGNRPETKNIFQKVLDFLKKIVGLTPTNIQDIYNNIELGKYKNAKRVNRTNQFRSLDRSLPEKTEDETKDILEGIENTFFDVLFEKNGFTPEILFQSKKISPQIFDKIKGIYEDNYNVLVDDETNEKLTENYRYVLNNWDKIINKTLESLSSFGVKLTSEINEKTGEVDLNPEMIQIEDPNLINDQSIVSDENKNTKGTYVEANQTSTKDLMYKQTKLLIKSLPKVDKNNNVLFNKSGFPQQVNFTETYNYLLRNLAGISDYSDMLDKIKELSEIKPEFKLLLSRLKDRGDNISYAQIKFQNQFRQDFDKNFTISYKTLVKPDGTIYMIDATKESSSGVIKETWRNNLKNDLPGITLDKEGRFKVTKDIVDTLDNIDFLNKIGINFSQDTLDTVKDNKKVNQAVLGIKKYLIDNKLDITDLYTSEKSSNAIGFAGGNINTLLDLEAQYSPNVTELSFISGEGKTVYPISNNNGLSIITNIINTTKANSKQKEQGLSDRDVLFSRLKHLNTITNQNSLYIKEMFDNSGNRKPGVKINLDLHDSVSTQETGEKFATKTSGLREGDRLAQEINGLLLYGKTAYLRSADKSNEFLTSLSKYSGNNILPVSTKSLELDFNNSRVKEIFHNYFKDELNGIAHYKLFGTGENIAYYGNKEKGNDKDPNNKGEEWTVFQSILSRETKKLIENKLEVLKSQDLTPQEKQEEIDKLADQLLNDVNIQVIEFLNKYVKELTNLFNENKISKDLGISKELKDFSFEQIVRSFAVNDFINSIEQTKLFTGNLSFYKDLFKRTSSMTGTKKTCAVDDKMNNWINKNYKRLDLKIADGNVYVLVYEDTKQQSDKIEEYTKYLQDKKVPQDQIDNIIPPYKKMVEGDAQGWITLDEYREFFTRTGDWNVPDKIFEKAQRGEHLTGEELQYFMPIKAQQAGPQVIDGLFAPSFHKYSLMPLIPAMCKGKNLGELLSVMTDKRNQVGYSLFKSGSKVGTLVDKDGKANKFYTEINHGEINKENLNIQTIDYRFLGIQLDISQKPHDTNIFGTQVRALLSSNSFDQGIEQWPGATKLFNRYDTIISDLLEHEKSKLVKELGLNPKDNYKQEDVTKLVKLLKKEATERNLADNIKDALDTITTEAKKVELKYPFDSQVNQPKIDSLLTSLINTRLIRQMMPGDAMIQGASTGFEFKGYRKEGSNDLKFFQPDKNGTIAMQVKVPMSKNYYSLLKKFNGNLDELNKAIRENKIDKKDISLVGYRIPTQELNSMNFMEIQEFLPEANGNLIILPSEIVAQSGGDFDIDKLQVFRPHLDTKGDEIKEKQNELIDIIKTVLSQDYNFESLISPNSTSLFTDIVEDMKYNEFKDKHPDSKETKEEYTEKQKKEASNIKYTNQLKVTEKIKQFVNLLSGKSGVGIGAIKNTALSIFQRGNITLNKFYTNRNGDSVKLNIFFKHNQDDQGRVILSTIKNIDGVNISKIISQSMNAHLDVANDPFISYLNINEDTYGVFTYLTHVGVPLETTLYFLRQPIISEYLKELSINDNIFIKATNKNISKNNISDNIIKNYQDKLSERGEKTEYDNRYFDNTITNEMKSYLTKKSQESTAFLINQIQFLKNFVDYQNQSSTLSEATTLINHATAGLGSNLGAIENKQETKERVLKSGFINGLEDLIDKTYIKAFDQNDFAKKAYGQFYNTQKPEILKNNRFLLNYIGGNWIKTENKDKLITLINNDFNNYIVQNYAYSKEELASIRTDLFSGDNSLAKQILTLKIEKNDLSNNLLIKTLYPLLRDKKLHPNTDNIRIYNKKLDTFSSNQLTEAFREINEQNPKLGKNLMDFGILQSGMNNSPITYMGLIPFEYYGDLINKAYDNYNKKNGAQDITKFNQLFIRNNVKDSNVSGKASDLNLVYYPLGNGMYGKDYSLDNFDSKLIDIKEDIKEEKKDSKQEDNNYTSPIIDTNEIEDSKEEDNNSKDYNKDLVKSEENSIFANNNLSQEQLIKDIQESSHTENMKKELLDDLSKVDSEKSLADLLRKFCA